MNYFQGAFLGVLQGLTEFLPVSSSGHLALFEHLFGFKEPSLFFNVMVHFGTLLAVILYFWRDLVGIVLDSIVGIIELAKGEKWSDVVFKNPKLKLFLLILIASIPTGLMGFFLKDFFEGLFSSLVAVGFAFWITTLLMWLTQFIPEGNKDENKTGIFPAFIIGIFQGIAITPGISRSGATISAALYFGINRQLAARFSFLMAIPAILGATLLEFKDVLSSGESLPFLGPVLLGTVLAAIVGYLSIRFLIKVLNQGIFHRFAYYTLAVGAVCFVVSIFGK